MENWRRHSGGTDSTCELIHYRSAVVSDQGVLTEFSYQVVLENGGEVIIGTQSGEITDLGATDVRESRWLADARVATN